MGKKSTDGEIALRVQEVYECIVQGLTYNDIVRYCKEKWNITSTRTVHEYVKRATEQISQKVSEKMEYTRDEAVTRYLRLYVKSYKEGRTQDCIRILSRLDKINGLEVFNIHHSGKVEIADLKEVYDAIYDQVKRK